jgi:membrane protease YdiL (CAAX protease family)
MDRGRLRAVGVAFLVALAGFALGIGLIVVGSLVLVGVLGLTVGPVGQLALSLVSIQGIAFPAVAYLYLRRRNLTLSWVPARVPSVREVGVIVAGYVGAFVLVLVGATLITSLTGSTGASNQAGVTALENPEIIPILIPVMILLVGPGEELLFRGVIQGTLRERFEAPAAIVLASLMFAPPHILALVGSPQAMLTTVTILLVPSLVFGTVYEYTENIVVPSLVHGIYNATLLALLWAAVALGEAPTTPALL